VVQVTISSFDTRYENFPTWKEPLEFEVDGVLVKAVAVHSWRQEWVDITEPFHLGVGVFCAPLVCIGAAMLGRRKSLAARGLTERDDCIRIATHAYHREATYFRFKPEVDREQEEFLSVFRSELEMLLNESNQAKERFRTERRVLLQQLLAHELDQKKIPNTFNDFAKGS
jgi:hypothetical protein